MHISVSALGETADEVAMIDECGRACLNSIVYVVRVL